MLERLFIFFLLFFGVTVGLVSLYFSSLSGLMGKLGLVGGDLNQAVHTNDFVRNVYEVGTTPQCAWWDSVKAVPQYLFSPADSRVELGLVLAQRRTECGVVYILDGNIERGIYTLLKGLYYERANHLELLRLVEKDTSYCTLFDDHRSYGYIEAYLQSSEGNARDSIAPVFAEVEGLRQSVSERCID
jgi:hypothetical protein